MELFPQVEKVHYDKKNQMIYFYVTDPLDPLEKIHDLVFQEVKEKREVFRYQLIATLSGKLHSKRSITDVVSHSTRYLRLRGLIGRKHWEQYQKEFESSLAVASEKAKTSCSQEEIVVTNPVEARFF